MTKAVVILTTEDQWNAASAQFYITGYQKLRTGKEFQRSMSAPAVDYLLTRISTEFGIEAARAAVQSTRLHVEYFERVNGQKLNSLSLVADRHARYLASPIDPPEEEKAFENAVARARRISPEKRAAALAASPRKPLRVRRIVMIFERNPYVVATVLDRANGVCESCHKPAPFKRSKDDQPYLEVHHKKQLANGGEDTVENALAICPNCHRDHHYGPRGA